MLAPIRKFGRVITRGVWLVFAFGMISCATQKKDVTLVADPDAKKESALPWNKQESWEQGSAMGGLVNSDHANH
jgi:hypothetical protein